MRVERLSIGLEDLEATRAECLEELKDRMWREVWRDMVELEGVDVSVREVGDGIYSVTAEI